LNCFQNGLGFNTNASFGIFNKEVPVVAQRSWEIKKVLDKALAEDRNPNPSFRGVNYDGVSVRCTKDPIPGVELSHEQKGEEAVLRGVTLYLNADQFEALKKAVSVAGDLNKARYVVLPELVDEGVIPFNTDTLYGCEKRDADYFVGLARSVSQEMRSPFKNLELRLREHAVFNLPTLV
jgi:hypothetical protein